MNVTDPARRFAADRRWLSGATALGLALVVLASVSRFGPLDGEPSGVAAALVVTFVPAWLLLAASRRPDLQPRLRQSLLLLALSIGLTSAGNLLRLVSAAGVPLPSVPGLDITTTCLIWALGLAALVRIPLAPLPPGAWRHIVVDVAIAVLGMVLVIVVLWALPGIRAAPPAAHAKILAYNVMEAANLVVLTVILARGPLRPVRRAFWCLAATIVIETTYLVALQYAIGQRSDDLRLANALFFLDYLAFLFAGALFATEPEPEHDTALLPESLRAFNPLSGLAVCGVAVLLVVSAARHTDPGLMLLVIGVGCMSILLLVRVLLATRENLRLARAEAARERRRQDENVRLFRRLTGGISHVINNQMTVVLGHAELGLMAGADGRAPSRSGFEPIIGAARNVTELARRLRLASGDRLSDPELVPLAEAVLRHGPAVMASVGEGREVVWDLIEGGELVAVSRSGLETILLELVSNACNATPDGGRLTIGVREETLAAPAPDDGTSPRAGRYAVLEVADTGAGIAAADLPHVFDPFFTDKPAHEARGLGLSVIHGIATSCGGSVRVESAAGAGTRVRVFFPTVPRLQP